MHSMMHEAPVASSNSIIAPYYPIGSGLTFTRKSRDLQSSLPPGTGPSALSHHVALLSLIYIYIIYIALYIATLLKIRTILNNTLHYRKKYKYYQSNIHALQPVKRLLN